MLSSRSWLLAAAAVASAACGSSEGASASASSSSSSAGGGPHGDAFDVPIDGVDAAQTKAFFAGDDLFDVPLHEHDGLGPLYIRSSCGGCHDKGVRGPGSVQKMSVVLADGITTSSDQSKLPFGHTVHPLLAAGAKTPILPPANDPSVKVTIRVGPPILGRGYMEAVDEGEILRVEAEQKARKDGIHGRANHVVYKSRPNPDPTFNAHETGDVILGRFGLKARIGTLDEFTADALQGDMGITSPLRPDEIPNPDGLKDDDKPGVDVTAESVNARAMYMRLTAIPYRETSEAGKALFAKALCDACHVPSLKTRADYPIALLAGIDAPIFTDMLLHDMGDELADGMIDGDAQSRDWRTAPLIGLRFLTSFLHDGRAHDVEEAILAHDGKGSEAAPSVALFKALGDDDKKTLITFVNAL